jgi:protein TonB
MDFPARVISKTPIEYPVEARAARVQGIVMVEVLIDEMGQVMKADVVSGDRRLAKSVLASVKLWRFEPELENGRPVVSRLAIPINFKIK